MLKTRYFTVLNNDGYCQEIPYTRGILHGIFGFLILVVSLNKDPFIWPGFPLIVSLNYLISFIYHRIHLGETLFRFLDYNLVLLRILIFSEYLVSGLFFSLLPLLAFLGITIVGLREQSWKIWLHGPHNEKYAKLLHKYYEIYKKYYIIVVITEIIQFIYWNELRKKSLGAVFLPAGFYFATQPKMPWHGKYWSYHEDFHLILLFADLYLIFFYK